MNNYHGIINLDLLDDCYCVYTMTSSLNDNSIYIGVSSDHIARWKQHANNRIYKNKNKNIELYT